MLAEARQGRHEAAARHVDSVTRRDLVVRRCVAELDDLFPADRQNDARAAQAHGRPADVAGLGDYVQIELFLQRDGAVDVDLHAVSLQGELFDICRTALDACDETAFWKVVEGASPRKGAIC